MRCSKCGREVWQGQDHCGFCGAPVREQRMKSLSLELTPDEAYYGCQKIVNYSGFVSPMRVVIAPGALDGMRLLIKNAQFYDSSGSKVVRPVCVVISIRLKVSAGASKKAAPTDTSAGSKKVFGVLGVCLLALLLLLAAAGLCRPSDGADSISGFIADAVDGNDDDTIVPLSVISIIDDDSAPSPSPLVQPTPVPDTSQPQLSAVRTEAEALIENFGLRYFINAMDDEQLENFCAMYEAALNYEPACTLPHEMTKEELDDMYNIMYVECPELLHIYGAENNSYSYSYYQDTGMIYELQFSYELSEDEYRAQYRACKDKIAGLVSETEGMTDAERELYVYRAIASNCYYNMESTNCGSSYGALIENQAKCIGISLAMKWTMEEMGIQCMCITGDTPGEPVGHAWNIIRLDGEYYDLDVTADAQLDAHTGVLTYYAYNVSDTLIRKKHIVNDFFERYAPILGSSTMDNSYYALAGRYIRSGQPYSAVMDELVLEAADNGGEYVGLQFESKSDLEALLGNFDWEVNSRMEAGGLSYQSWNSLYEGEYAYVLCFRIIR